MRPGFRAVGSKLFVAITLRVMEVISPSEMSTLMRLIEFDRKLFQHLFGRGRRGSGRRWCGASGWRRAGWR